MIEKLTAGMKSWIKQDHQDICESPAEYDIRKDRKSKLSKPAIYRRDKLLDIGIICVQLVGGLSGACRHSQVHLNEQQDEFHFA